ncbi:P-loop containing nucleoside triphosphate hydrolase protein, partial [Mycena floridula]
FYIRFRQAVAHAGCEDESKWYNPQNLAEWKLHPSKKIEILSQIIQHHLDRDNRYPLQEVNDEIKEYEYDIHADIDSPAHPIIVEELVTNTIPRPKSVKVYDESVPTSETSPDKIVVYCAFPSSYAKIIQALECLGMALKKRNEIIARFNDPTGPRVLILSNVGATGLNLQVARIIIIFDTTWSHQSLEQLIGRIWRHGQTKQVDVYHIVAKGTPDVFLNNLSFSKAALHDMFVGQATSERFTFT